MIDAAGQIVGLALLLYAAFVAVRYYAWHRAAEPGEGRQVYLGRAILFGAIVVIMTWFWGAAAAYQVWLFAHAPARTWSEPAIAVAGPDIALGGTADLVRSFRNEYEVCGSNVRVSESGGDLVVRAGRIDALKRSPGVAPADAVTVRAVLYRRHLRSYSGRRSGVAVDLQAVDRSPAARLAMDLSGLSPHAAAGPVELRLRNGLRECQPDCGIGFELASRGRLIANSTAIHVKSGAKP